MTVGEYQRNLTEKLKNAGAACPENEAEQLILAAAQKDRLWLFLNRKDSAEPFLAKAEAMEAERLSGRPLQYILGEAWFMGLPYYVNEAVLIPRQDTELTAETAESFLQKKMRQTQQEAADPVPETGGKALAQPADAGYTDSLCGKDAVPGADAECGAAGAKAQQLSVLDLCTGSGALAVFLKCRFPQLFVTASDISPAALAVARKNAERNGCPAAGAAQQAENSHAAGYADSGLQTPDAAQNAQPAQQLADTRSCAMEKNGNASAFQPAQQPAEYPVSGKALTASDQQPAGGISPLLFVQSDLFENINGSFDLIVTNPPYISTGEIPSLMREVRGFEPHLALDGGADGLDLVRRILRQAPAHMKPGALLLMEIGSEQGAAVQKLAEETGAFTDIAMHKDLNGLDRMLYAVRRA